MNKKRSLMLLILVSLLLISLMALGLDRPVKYSVTEQGKQIDTVWEKIRSYLDLTGDPSSKIWDPSNDGWFSFDEVYEGKEAKGVAESSQWKFQSGIENQWSDASQELKELLYCMRQQIPNKDIGKISSISDSAGLVRCRDNYAKPPCHHVEGSAHYGCGGQSQKSLAVDFADEANTCAIVAVAKACGVSKRHILGLNNPIYVNACGNDYTQDPMEGHEGHVHVSVQSARCY